MKINVFFALSIWALAGCQKAEFVVSMPIAAHEPPQAMVVTANPHATNAGVAILEFGGSATDAAIAIEAVLSLVEPQSSGLGGGGFMLHYDAKTKQIDVYDGRETAPAGATPTMFMTEDGVAMSFIDAKTSGLSIGVPGMVSLLNLAHQDHGTLPWSQLFGSAIQLSDTGFEVSPRLNGFLERFRENIPDSADEGPVDLYQYFYDADGAPRETLKNAAYAATLRKISENPRFFYEGELAEEIAAAANIEPKAGSLAPGDLAGYQARKLEPLCADYHELTLCGPPPPSSWVAVGMVMGMLESAPAYTDESPALHNWTTFGEALRLAYADRDQYVADTDFIDVPLTGLLHPEYLEQRAAEINPNNAASTITPGNPWDFEDATATVYGADATEDYAGTTHFAVVDAEGNAVAMTASVESIFGSTRMAGGMILNNQLTDFSRIPVDADGQVIPNAVEPFKRPRSSMSPTMVLNKNGEFMMSTGSPGGNSIISYTLKTLVGVLDWGLSPQEAVNLPNMVARGDVVRIESSRASDDVINALRDYGFEVRESQGENSGLSVILRKPDGSLEGGVDPRREGTIGIPELQ